ncbi:MAG: hypothetical protein IPK27_21730 [Rhodanobacteraceae bacterium]|nr:hypothetical protein [Rhodanobacteraceae bacterium]
MSWPWSTIGLASDATPAEIRAAFEAWKRKLDAGEVPGSARDTFEIERAFETAIELAEERDPSHLDASQYPDPWRDPDAPPAAQPPALRPEHPPLASADVLATTVLGLVRQAADFNDFATALGRVRAFADPATREGADRYLRDWMVDGGQLSPLQVVRLARAFGWEPESPPLQPHDRDSQWRQIVHQAYAIVSPPDPAYTGSIGRAFLVVGAVAGLGLAALLMPRVMAGGLRILIPVALAAICAWALIKWRR